MNQCYHNGDFWQCVTATSAGESPTTTAAKWRRIRIPGAWRLVLARLTYAKLLEFDGQKDKARTEWSDALTMDRGLERLVRLAANAEGDRKTPNFLRGTVQASVILDDAYGFIGWDADQLDTRQLKDARRALSAALQEVWEAWWWAELMVLEAVPIRDAYDATETYAPQDEVYFPATGKYYQALMPVGGLPPASLSGGEYTVNDCAWMEVPVALDADDFVSGTSYDWGDLVRDPDTGTYYMRSGGIAISDCATSAANTNYPMTGTYQGLPEYSKSEAAWRIYARPFWTIFADSTVVAASPASPAPLTPDMVTDWTSTLTVNTSVVAGLDETGFWSQVLPWDPTIDYTRTVRSVTYEDPRTENVQQLDFFTSGDGITIPEVTEGTVWIWSRRATPILTGDTWSATATYEAAATEDLVYDS